MAVEELRREKDHYFEHAHDSPLTVDQRAHFEGLRYFPDDPVFRFTVTVDPEGAGAVEEVEMSDGSTDHLPRAGIVRFDVGGERAGLTAFAQGDGLFIPFRDSTSGTETYGAGRYVEAEPLDDGRLQRRMALPAPAARELAQGADPRGRALLPLTARQQLRS
jgi:uncharacterized protein (DUF1684 family)